MANGVVANGGNQVGLVLQACADCLVVGQNLRTVFQSVAGHAGDIDVVFGLDSLAGFIGAALQSAGLCVVWYGVGAMQVRHTVNG